MILALYFGTAMGTTKAKPILWHKGTRCCGSRLGDLRSRACHSGWIGAQFHQRRSHRRAPMAGERHTAPRV